MGQELEIAILAAEAARCAAMLDKDIGALDALLDARLSFAHATGAVDDKTAYCAKIAAGKIDYLAIVWPEQTVLPLGGDHALLIGQMATQVRVDGIEKHLDNRVTTVWARAETGWRLLSFQSTPIRN